MNQKRLDFCKQVMGVHRTITMTTPEEALKEMHAQTGGTLYPVVIDATGNTKSMCGAFDYVAFTGRLVFVGITTDEVSFPDPLFHRREMTLLASRNALPRDFTRIIGLIEDGKIDTRPWITHRTDFDELIDRFPSYTKPETGVIKAVVEVGSDRQGASCRGSPSSGPGPIGLEAAAHAAHLGHSVTVYDRGDVAEAVGQWGHVRLFTPFGMNCTQLGLDLIRKEHPQHVLPGPNDLLTGHEYRDAYLVPLTLTSKLGDAVKTRTFVVTVGRAGMLKTDPVDDPKRATAPFRLLLRDDKGAERFEEADVVLDCTGTYGRHAWLGDGGIPAAGEIAAEKQVAYGVDDVLGRRKAHYAGKSVDRRRRRLFGRDDRVRPGPARRGEHRHLGHLADARAASTPLAANPNDPLRERDRLAAKANNLATRGDGNVEYHAQVLLDEVTSHGPDKGFRVAGRMQRQAGRCGRWTGSSATSATWPTRP